MMIITPLTSRISNTALAKHFPQVVTHLQRQQRRGYHTSKRRLSQNPRRKETLNKDKMKIAVEGCCHGMLDKIYAELQHLESTAKEKVDVLLICGDFQVCSYAPLGRGLMCRL
jgi:hypothetical protein